MSLRTTKALGLLALTLVLTAILSTIILVHLWQTPHLLVRHVNPLSEVEQRPSPGFMVLLYLSVMDAIIKGDCKAVAEGLRSLNLIYIPEAYRFIADRFHDLLNTTWKLVNETRALLDEAEALIRLGRGVEAKPLLQEALVKCEQARRIHEELKLALNELARSLGLPLSELARKIEELGKAIEELYLRLVRLMEAADVQQLLRDTFLFIDVEPKQVWTGGRIEVRGKLYAVGEGPLSGKLVKVYVDGVELARAETLEDGLFIVYVDLPYVYKPKIAVQARYLPQGVDGQVYRPTTSDDVMISLLYIQPRISLEVLGEPLPGKFLTVNGRVESEAPLPYDRVTVSWIGASSMVELVDGSFNLSLRVPEDLAEGRYPLTVKTPAFGVYAPAQETLYMNITKIPLDVKLQIPSIMMVGLPSTLKGEILNRDEVFNVSVKVVILAQTYTTTTSDGEFSLELAPPLTAITGHYVCEVYMSPAVPWYREAYFMEEVLVVNPFVLVVTLGLAALTFLKLSRGGVAEQEPKLSSEVKEIEPKMMKREQFAASEFEWVIDLYWQAIAIVTKFTGVEMKPSMTMREYLAAVSSRLGDLRSSFETLTLIAEKALYARTIAIEELELAKKAFEVIRLAGTKI
ncbi:MAG: DUF4129 domain-containing protein [Candidatus Nezhaarchaeales archaeon]